ncbi:hypothetical protein BC940DRAFT_315668 [Gongronella butleri]|nr:hypothetical protein BC940DRAFT_315668 [Gongronella butleri]
MAAAAAGAPGPNSANSANSTNSPGKRRRNVKLASAPIRRLDASPPTPAPASVPSASTPSSASVPNHYHLGQKRPRVAGKSNNMAAMAAQSRAHASDSDSGSSSDDDDDDSTDSSGSEESSSGSDSDDMDAFANDISRGMSDDDQPVASPFMASTVSSSRADQASTTTPSYLKPSPSRTAGHVLTPTMRAGPTSLRDLLGDGAGNREEVSGSSSDED